MLINNTRRDVKFRLEDLEITQADLAREMGWATQTLSATLNRMSVDQIIYIDNGNTWIGH